MSEPHSARLAPTVEGHTHGARPARAAAALLGLLLAAVVIPRSRRPTPVFADAPAAEEHRLILAVDRARADRYREAVLSFAAPGDAQLVDTAGQKGWRVPLRTACATGLLTRDVSDNFYLRDDFADDGRRELLPGHARWPTVEYLLRQRFALIFPKLSREGPEVAEIRADAFRRTRGYPFLHVTLPLGGGEYLRFFTTLPPEEVARRARERHRAACFRSPFGPLTCAP